MNPRVLIVVAIAGLPGVLHADHTDFVVINAAASKAYTQRKFVNGVAQPESYVFYEGKYFGGLTRDLSMVHTSFMDIAKVLAPNLAKQNYLPTKDIKAADLLIVVNWGTTVTDDTGKKSDPNTAFDLTDAFQAVQAYNAFEGGKGGMGSGGPTSGDSPSMTSADQALGELTQDLMQNQAKAMSAQKFAESNAALLGYTAAMHKEMAGQWASANGLSSEAESHLADLDEDRYFVILLAYDFKKIRNYGNAGASSTQPVWSVRMNIRADGNNFTEALPAMSKVAADYFGKQLDDLMSAQTRVGKNSRVEIGPVKVLDVAK
jgi:hypothetical protein